MGGKTNRAPPPGSCNAAFMPPGRHLCVCKVRSRKRREGKGTSIGSIANEKNLASGLVADRHHGGPGRRPTAPLADAALAHVVARGAGPCRRTPRRAAPRDRSGRLRLHRPASGRAQRAPDPKPALRARLPSNQRGARHGGASVQLRPPGLAPVLPGPPRPHASVRHQVDLLGSHRHRHRTGRDRGHGSAGAVVLRRLRSVACR